MPYNEKSRLNLQPQKFNENTNRGRKKDSRNRKTIAKDMLSTTTPCIDPTDPNGSLIQMSIAEQIMWAQVKRAIKSGDTNAAHLLLDAAYGKVGTENDIQAPIITYDLSNATDEELTKMGECLTYVNSLHVKYRIDPNAHIEEAEQVR